MKKIIKKKKEKKKNNNTGSYPSQRIEVTIMDAYLYFALLN